MLGLCLAIIAGLFSNVSRALTFEEGSDAAMRELVGAVHTIRDDVEQADPPSLRTPSSTVLLLNRVAADDMLGDLPMPMAAPSSAPLRAPRLQAIRYSWDTTQGILFRSASGTDRVLARARRFSVGVYPSDVPELVERCVEASLTMEGPAGSTNSVSFTVRPRVRGYPSSTVLP